jgi:hypothetical protein
VGQAVAEQQTQDRRARLEYPEDEAHAQPGASIDTCHPDADRGGEVGQAKGEGNQQESQHAPYVTQRRCPDGLRQRKRET